MNSDKKQKNRVNLWGVPEKTRILFYVYYIKHSKQKKFYHKAA